MFHRSLFTFTAFCIVFTFAFSARAHAENSRQRLRFDLNWRFHLGDSPDAGKSLDYPEISDLAKTRPDQIGKQNTPAANLPDPVQTNLGGNLSFVQPNFNDHDWRTLDLPHDWAVELPFTTPPEGKKDAALVSHGFKPVGPGFAENNIGWYRRSFNLPADDAHINLSLEFDGVYRNSLVWLNGHCLGRNLSGYSSFAYDITRFANFGGANTLVVRVDASRYEGWFYEGAGIYRHVWLVKTSPVHIAHWGTFVTTQLSGTTALVTQQATITNPTSVGVTCSVISNLTDDAGHPVGTSTTDPLTIPANDQRDLTQHLSLPDAKLWSPDSPTLYHWVTTVKLAAQPDDMYQTTFGVRTVAFDPNQGFILNGKPLRIYGTCNHQDHAGVGSAIPDALQDFRIATLKQYGCNAYRTSHNPPTPELLDACDRLGMIVLDETRRMDTSPQAIDELQRLVLRDRNHPSVCIWSIGNEETLIQNSDDGKDIAVAQQKIVRAIDPTRPITYAANNGPKFPGINSVIEVRGWNYNITPATDQYHIDHPTQPNLGTEQGSTVATRGIYVTDKAAGYVSAYDENEINPKRGGGRTVERWWTFFASRSWLSGGFIWTGFDYRGEPTPYAWPCISCHFGIVDTCGFPKDNAFYYQAWWSDKPVLHLFPHWNWAGKEGQPIQVGVYSNCDEVELFLNNQSLGKQTMKPNSKLYWKVKYAPGVLVAKGTRNGQQLEAKVETTGPAAAVGLSPDRPAIRADGEDVSVVAVSVLDAGGRTVPTADNLINFQIDGGRILGVGNGDPSSHEPDQASQRHAFNGYCQVIIQSDTHAGPMHLHATAGGLTPAEFTINKQPAEPRPFVP